MTVIQYHAAYTLLAKETMETNFCSIMTLRYLSNLSCSIQNIANKPVIPLFTLYVFPFLFFCINIVITVDNALWRATGNQWTFTFVILIIYLCNDLPNLHCHQHRHKRALVVALMLTKRIVLYIYLCVCVMYILKYVIYVYIYLLICIHVYIRW